MPEIVLPEEAATSDKIIPVAGLTGRVGGGLPRVGREATVTEFLQTLILGLLIGGVYALLASGLTLIFGVMNVINIAHGAFLILAAFMTWSIWTATGLDPLVAILITHAGDVRVRLAALHVHGPADPQGAAGRRRCC